MTPSLPTFSIASASILPIVGVAVGADGADLGDVRLVLRRRRELLDLRDDGRDGRVDAALEVHRVSMEKQSQFRWRSSPHFGSCGVPKS